jgi:hypothetical protein
MSSQSVLKWALSQVKVRIAMYCNAFLLNDAGRSSSQSWREMKGGVVAVSRVPTREKQVSREGRVNS